MASLTLKRAMTTPYSCNEFITPVKRVFRKKLRDDQLGIQKRIKRFLEERVCNLLGELEAWHVDALQETVDVMARHADSSIAARTFSMKYFCQVLILEWYSFLAGSQVASRATSGFGR